MAILAHAPSERNSMEAYLASLKNQANGFSIRFCIHVLGGVKENTENS